MPARFTFDGIIRLPQKQSWFQPPNEPLKNHWFYLSPAEMALASGLPLRTDLYLDAVKTDIPGGLSRSAARRASTCPTIT